MFFASEYRLCVSLVDGAENWFMLGDLSFGVENLCCAKLGVPSRAIKIKKPGRVVGPATRKTAPV